VALIAVVVAVVATDCARVVAVAECALVVSAAAVGPRDAC
jgi:hypothetical protein